MWRELAERVTLAAVAPPTARLAHASHPHWRPPATYPPLISVTRPLDRRCTPFEIKWSSCTRPSSTPPASRSDPPHPRARGARAPPTVTARGMATRATRTTSRLSRHSTTGTRTTSRLSRRIGTMSRRPRGGGVGSHAASSHGARMELAWSSHLAVSGHALAPLAGVLSCRVAPLFISCEATCRSYQRGDRARTLPAP